jgi:hypothetical protein
MFSRKQLTRLWNGLSSRHQIARFNARYCQGRPARRAGVAKAITLPRQGAPLPQRRDRLRAVFVWLIALILWIMGIIGIHPASTAGKLDLRYSMGMEQSFGPERVNRFGEGKAAMQAEPFSGVAVPLEVETITADPVEAGKGRVKLFAQILRETGAVALNEAILGAVPLAEDIQPLAMVAAATQAPKVMMPTEISSETALSMVGCSSRLCRPPSGEDSTTGREKRYLGQNEIELKTRP